MKRKAALALGIALIAVIVLCLFSCGHEEKPQADAPGSQTVSGTDADTEDESAAEDPAKDSESEKTDSEKDSKKDAAKDSSTTSTSTNKKTGSSTSGSNKTSSKTSSGSSSKTSGKTSSGSTSASGKTSGSSGKDYGQGTPKPQGNSGNNGSNGGTKPDPAPQPQPQPTPDPPAPAADPMNWPGNEYTALIPRPSTGTVQQTDMQDGVYCLLLTGADMSDVKAYASALINAGYINEVTETVESGTYLFGGGNSNGNFVVVSYQNGQFIIGVQP
ncbi:MAG: hypothetical protein IKE40_07975 [Firmicutes bacterium]|nr:hypothetical protein [Bacillota bacterium]